MVRRFIPGPRSLLPPLLAALLLAALSLGTLTVAAGCSRPRADAPGITPGYRVESGQRFAYTMEVPVGWESLRGAAQEGARVGKPGTDFVADISVAREVTQDASLLLLRSRVDAFLEASRIAPLHQEAAGGSGLGGWMWELPGQPAEGQRPQREPYQLVVLYDPRGFQWVLTYSWANAEAREQYLPAFRHALETFRAQ